ncbi:unnamed protein product, partial [Darwinula stevensoni]
VSACPPHIQGRKIPFGLMFDIDGVLVRGKKVLSYALEAFSLLVDSNKNFLVPTVFVTNAGNTLRHQKAESLSSWLNVPINADQVIMSHSPLRLYREFHNKKVLITGQGPVKEVAANVGFNNVVTVDDLRSSFPLLDAVDQRRRIRAPCNFGEYYTPIEGVVLFGDPVRWETCLQLIIDILMTDGKPYKGLKSIPYPHLPIIACNMDLHWMAEAPLPRFGHGAFMVCLESLYKKITGKDLIYTALVGKPSEVTFHYAAKMVTRQAERIGVLPKGGIQRLYVIGDNVNTDVFGGNLYNQYVMNVKTQGNNGYEQPGLEVEDFQLPDHCYSILVETGVYGDHSVDSHSHSPRDFVTLSERLRKPSFITENVLRAVELVLHRECLDLGISMRSNVDCCS